jgi:butyrate kinase
MGMINELVAGTSIGVKIYPGQNEMYALAFNAIRVLQGKEPVKTYNGSN